MQTLTQVNRYTTKKDGSALVTSKGRAYTSIRIKTQEYGDKQISGFGNSENENWKVGDSVDITITPKGEYLNFEMPKRDSNTGGDKFGNSLAEVKNLITLKLEPLMERNNAGIQKLETMLIHLENQISMLIKQDVDEAPDESMPFYAPDDPEENS